MQHMDSNNHQPNSDAGHDANVPKKPLPEVGQLPDIDASSCLPPAPSKSGLQPDTTAQEGFSSDLHDSILDWLVDTGHPVLALQCLHSRFVDGDLCEAEELESLLRDSTTINVDPFEDFRKRVLDSALLYHVMTVGSLPDDSLLEFVLQTIKLPGALPSLEEIAEIVE